MTARSFGFLPRQAMFFLGFGVKNILGKRTKMKLFKGEWAQPFYEPCLTSLVTVVLWMAGW